MNEKISLQELRDSGELSVRAYNICWLLKLETIEDLQRKIDSGFNFLKVRNCGQRTIVELEQIRALYGSEIKNPVTPVIESTMHPLTVQRFQNAVSERFARLSVRAQNALRMMFSGNLPTHLSFRTVVLNNPRFTIKQKNVGTKTFDELHTFFERLKTTYTERSTETVAPHESAQFHLESLTGIKAEMTDVEDMVRGSFALIRFCAQHFEALVELTDVEHFIFKNLTVQLDRVYDFESIAKRFGYSKERIRQLSLNLKKEVPQKIKKRFDGLLPYTVYRSQLENENFIDVNAFFKGGLVQAEMEEVGSRFAGYVLASLFAETHYLISALDKLPKPEEIFQYNVYRECKRIRGVYLVKKSVVEKDVLLDVLAVCFSEVCKRQERSKTVPYATLVARIATIAVVPAVDIIAYLLYQEFAITAAATGIHIEKNTSKMIYEYVEEALETLQRPSHVSAILQKVTELFPAVNLTEDSIKSVIPRYKKVFIFFGRSSTYGLRAWEKKFQHIKGGTIRDIAEEFLNGFDEPCHISAITGYVNKYRKTNDYSVLTNLKYTGENRFCFFKKGYVGLANKSYPQTKHKANAFQEVSLDDLLETIFSK